MADPGFPVWGGINSRGSYILKILYVETKESGPLGGHAPGKPPRSTNDIFVVAMKERVWVL